MMENYELVQRGFRILVSSLSGYIGRELCNVYHTGWWDEVLSALSDQYNLPQGGTYGELTDSLDIANCIRLIDRKWNDVFRARLSMNCRTWARELMGVRNIVSHIGQQDLGQIKALYMQIRSRSADLAPAAFEGIPQPESDSVQGALKKGSLLELVGTDMVQKTTLSRKVTYNGKTNIYPVYRVRLDLLYYNDQNDRIATWITRYKSEHGQDALSALDSQEYNQIIEGFITESNQEAIYKTQKNISLVGQREPGVTLSDGRIVDGNRRFTCLRRINVADLTAGYFETVIMDMDIRADQKQIKLLELSIQHGEESKVDYDLIDYAIGTYRDIELTHLLTVEEYAASTNEPASEVRKRLEIAAIVDEFLTHIRLPGQYHAARDYQVYSLFVEMLTPLHRMSEDGRKQLKSIIFNNSMMGAVPDQRKFIRDIKNLVKNDAYSTYFEEQAKLDDDIQRHFMECEIHSKQDVDQFAEAHPAITEELNLSLEHALLRSRSQKLKARPTENITKCINLMLEIDPRLFGKMNPDEVQDLKSGLEELSRIADNLIQLL